MSNVPATIRKNPIAKASEAREMVLACKSLEQAQEMAAQSEAYASYFSKRLGTATEEARAWSEVVVLTKRRIGELLPPKPSPEESGQRGGRGKKAVPAGNAFSRKQKHEARALANVPQEDLDAYLGEQREAGKPPSVSGAMKRTAKRQPEDDKAATEWAHAYEVASKLEASAAKALKISIKHMEDEPRELSEALKKTHAHLTEAMRAIGGFAFNALSKRDA